MASTVLRRGNALACRNCDLLNLSHRCTLRHPPRESFTIVAKYSQLPKLQPGNNPILVDGRTADNSLVKMSICAHLLVMGDTDDTTTETGVGAAIAIVALISVGLRFYTHHYTHAGFRFDDWLILASLIFFIATDIVVVLDPNGSYVASTPGIEYTPADVLYTNIIFIASILYFPITSTTKLSIILLYNRLFSVRKAFRRRIIVLCIAVIGDPRFCFNYNIFWLATGITEAILDVFIIIVPIEVVSKLQLNTRKKIAHVTNRTAHMEVPLYLASSKLGAVMFLTAAFHQLARLRYGPQCTLELESSVDAFQCVGLS
ncbi:hypothetical protein CIB48_g2124 [Xylaria polymorpha]|nr:hypothetical protein CIB48_g2124 [Xylaria polymorpha]